jgi:hypothetical protein
VTVNGQVATIFEDHFVANHVPLQEGENTITVIGTDSQGYTAAAEITVYAQTTGDHITITVDTESGVSPFETTLQVEGTFDFSQEPIITPNGPDDVDPFEGLGDAQYQIGMTIPGIYYFTAEATDDQSNTYSDTIAVVVLDQAQLDSLLRAKWNGMKTALTNGDTEKALTYYREGMREKYSAIFNALGSELPTLVQQMKAISPIVFAGDQAKYRIKQDHNIEGQIVTISYYIYFSKGENGLWQIEKY